MKNSQYDNLQNNNFNPSLGIITGNSSSLVPQGFSQDEKDKLKQQKWYLKYHATRILVKLKEGDKLPRTCSCLRQLNKTFSGVGVNYVDGDNRKSAHFSNLMRCGSVWRCPICSSRISEIRRQELQQAMEIAKQKGLKPYLLTLTIKHGFGDNLDDILEKMHKAAHIFVSGRKAHSWRQGIGLFGTVRALEVTYGKNGFHPHFHYLIFTKNEIKAGDIMEAIDMWEKACLNAKLPAPHREIGCVINDGKKANNYVAKWGLENELTKGHFKLSKSDKGLSPWGLLKEAAKGCKLSEKAFLTYAKSFHGRRQLFWSQGLKEKLGIFDKTDEDIINEDEKTGKILGLIPKKVWKMVYLSNFEPKILIFAEKYPEKLKSFFNYIQNLTFNQQWNMLKHLIVNNN